MLPYRLRIIWVRVRATLHNWWTFHYYQATWYNGPGRETYNQLWKIYCKQCPKVYYLDEGIDKFINEQIEIQNSQARIDEREAVKSRMN